ncbi:hypothetical protein HP548_19020 [Paenibacillus taichungensis]|uniref:Uncharacterized protein n=1 Tax=Paenibacillus taichungensis TaxID=484184 RepID=A0ABX2MQ24_9BACL|nr:MULTISPECIES: hypothetical protein [Paenibacillus]NUU56172.1 hypothetical protein [Paenibacillus taichungensis]PIH55682.1 hypothetical protein CS562_29955 [Paenibacillus sp. LK1]
MDMISTHGVTGYDDAASVETVVCMGGWTIPDIMKGEVLYLHVLNTADRRIETCLERSVVIEREHWYEQYQNL